MTSPLTTAILAVSCCMGVCLGGAINAYDQSVLKEAVESPALYHLVDKEGNPVSKELN